MKRDSFKRCSPSVELLHMSSISNNLADRRGNKDHNFGPSYNVG